MPGLKQFLDDTFGSPEEALRTVRGISETLNNLDNAKLRLVKSVLDSAGVVKGDPEELQAVLDILRLITGASMEQLNAIKSITTNLTKLVKLLPKGGLSELKGLSLKELAKESTQGGRRDS